MEITRPAVLKWYRLYCAAMAFLYIALLGLMIALFFIDTRASGMERLPPALYNAYLGFIAALSLIFAAAFLLTFMLPRKPWTWIYHLVMICIGMTSACCMPASIPLLIFWIKPETKAYFGRGIPL